MREERAESPPFVTRAYEWWAFSPLLALYVFAR